MMSEPSEAIINEANRRLREYIQQLDDMIKATRDGGSVAMVESDRDGGPAFPHGPMGDTMHGEDGREWHQFPAGTGMSLRDWFAGMALQGMLANGNEFGVLFESDTGRNLMLPVGQTPSDCGEKWTRIAGPSALMTQQAFSYADAMLKARVTAKPTP